MTMRTIAILAATVVLAAACQQKKTVDEAAASYEWPELDAFHMVIAESFHPYADSGNLEPARKYAAEMASLAEEWAGQPLPEKVDTERYTRPPERPGQRDSCIQCNCRYRAGRQSCSEPHVIARPVS